MQLCGFSISQLYNHHSYLIPKTFLLCPAPTHPPPPPLPEGTSIPISSHAPFPFPQLPATTNLLRVSVDLPFLNISCKQNDTKCGLLCLVSFMFSRFTLNESYFSWSPFLKIFSLGTTMILVSQLLPYSPYNARQSGYLLFQSCCSMDRFSGIEN